MPSNSKYKNGEESWRFMGYSTVGDDTGELGVLEYGKELDFVVKRVFYLRGIEKEAVRGLHSHKELKQLIVCLNGEFTIELDNGVQKISALMRPGKCCLYLDGKVWREMRGFSDDAVVMVLCDREYKYDEVVRDRVLFKKNLEIMNNAL